MKFGENSPSGLEDRDSGCCIRTCGIVTRQLNVRPPTFSAQSPEPTSTAVHGMVASLRAPRTKSAHSPTMRKRLPVVANPQDLVSDTPLHNR